jgi:hypothetical protein
MKLYSGPLSMFGAKVEIALREKGAEFELEMVPFDQSTSARGPRLPSRILYVRRHRVLHGAVLRGKTYGSDDHRPSEPSGVASPRDRAAHRNTCDWGDGIGLPVPDFAA